MKNKIPFLLIIGILCLFSSSCNPDGIIQLFDKALSDLDRNSSEWQSVLLKLAEDLPEDVSKTIKKDIQQLANNTIGIAGVEVKCTVDFFRSRVKQDLQNIKAAILGGVQSNMKPEFCTLNIPNINLNDEKLDDNIFLYGYDFYSIGTNKERISAYLLSANGRETKISNNRIGINTNYQMTLNISGLAKTLYEQKSVKIFLKFNDSKANLPEIIVNKWIPKIRTIEGYQVRGGSSEFRPPNRNIPSRQYTISGDRDFDTGGNDPTKVKLNTQVKINGSKIEARTYLYARESKGDHTRLSGWSEWWTLYEAPNNYIVNSFSPSKNTIVEDNITSKNKRVYKKGGETVRNYTLYLDRSGDDRGIHTSVLIEWNKLDITIKQLRPDFS